MTLQVGFTGCGNITDTHARAAREAGLGIAAFHGRDLAKAAAFAARFGGRAYERFEDFLAHRPLDLVVIGSPSALHAEQGIAAARAGLHVLTEKPIDVTVAKGEALVAAAESAGRRLGVLFQDRLKPELLRLREFVAAGGLGRVLLASARVKWHRPPEYYAASHWRGRTTLDGGAALINQGVHTVDLMLWLLGDVRRVKGFAATTLHAIESEDVALALLEFASGAAATFEATTAAWPGYPRRVELSGTEGTIVVEGDRVTAADLRRPAPELVSAGDEGAGAGSSAAVADATPHRRMIEDFVRAIETGSRPACDGREGLRSLAVVEAVYRAAREPGQAVA